MNILQILPALNSGGVERGTIDIARYITERGHKAFVVSGGGYREEELKGIAEHIKLPVGKKNPITAIYSIERLSRIIENKDIDIVHARSRVPAWIAYLAVKKVNKRRLKKDIKAKTVRFITTCHGKYSKSGFSRIMAMGNKVIVPSRFIGNYMQDSFGLDADKIELIYRGVDVSRFPFRPANQRPDKPVIALLGRITPKKGHMLAVDCLSELTKKYPALQLWFIGEASKGKTQFLDKLKNYIRQKGLESRVRFLGAVSDVPSVLRNVSVLIAPSQYDESFGRMIIEAQACGIPVVASDRPAFNEIISDTQTGLLCRPDSYDDFAKACDALISNSTLYNNIVLSGRKKVEESFALDVMCEKTLKVYEQQHNKKTIAIIKYSAFGDLALSMLSLSNLKMNLPNSEIVFITGKLGKALTPHGLAHKFIPWQKDILKLSARVNFYNVDAVIDLQNKLRTHLLCRMLNAVSFGFNVKSGWLMSRPVKYVRSFPIAEQERLFNTLGLSWNAKMIRPLADVEAIKRVQSRLIAMGLQDGDKLCVFNCSASKKWETKNLSIEQSADIISKLISRSVKIALCGDRHSKKIAEHILDRLTDEEKRFVFNLAGATAIEELVALISLSDCLITPDSGPMHVAFILNRPFIVYFGPTASERHLPIEKGRFSAVEKEMDCGPCYKHKCPLEDKNRCLRDIEESIVREALNWIEGVK